jgi:hypothetical protein
MNHVSKCRVPKHVTIHLEIITSVQIVMQIENKYNIIHTTHNEMIQNKVLNSGLAQKCNIPSNAFFKLIFYSSSSIHFPLPLNSESDLILIITAIFGDVYFNHHSFMSIVFWTYEM